MSAKSKLNNQKPSGHAMVCLRQAPKCHHTTLYVGWMNASGVSKIWAVTISLFGFLVRPTGLCLWLNGSTVINWGKPKPALWSWYSVPCLVDTCLVQRHSGSEEQPKRMSNPKMSCRTPGRRRKRSVCLLGTPLHIIYRRTARKIDITRGTLWVHGFSQA